LIFIHTNVLKLPKIMASKKDFVKFDKVDKSYDGKIL